jgi:Protein of unknown function (DUF1344)
MIRGIATLLIVALLGWVGVVSAQQQTPVAPRGAYAQATSPATAEKTVEGKVKAVDPAQKQVTLEDGTVLTIPPTVPVSWAELQPGKTVAVIYTVTGEAGQQGAVKKIEVK